MLSREGGWIRTRGGVDLHTASRRHVEPQQEDVEAMYRSRAAWLCSGFYSFTSSYVPRYYNIYIRYLNETLLAMENPHCKPVRDSVPVGFTEPLTRSRRKPTPARTGAVLHGNGYGLRGKTPGLPVTFPSEVACGVHTASLGFGPCLRDGGVARGSMWGEMPPHIMFETEVWQEAEARVNMGRWHCGH